MKRKKMIGKGIAALFIAFCAIVGSLVGGYFGFTNSINARAMTSTDTATVSLYVEPYEGPVTIVPTQAGGSTGLYRTSGGAGEQPAQIVPEEENPAAIIASPERVNYYPVLGFIGIVLALILLILWKIKLRRMRKAGRIKKKR